MMGQSLEISDNEDNMMHSQQQDKHESASTLNSEDFFKKYKSPSGIFTSAFRLFGQSSPDNESSQEEESGETHKRKPRGSYRKYTFDEKQIAVERIQNGEDVKVVSRQYGIPRRNLLRWRKNGCERKQGGGRPTDRDMETELFDKIHNQVLTTQKMVRQEAIRLSKSGSFKASKGWFLKFCRRYKLNFGTEGQANSQEE